MAIVRETRLSSALAQHSRWQGTLALVQCDRLCQAVSPEASDTLLQVDISVDDRKGWPRLHGRIGGCLGLHCQRCEKSYGLDLDIALDLRLVSSEQQERALQSECDAYWVQDDLLPLQTLIEDEILLALPMLARCEACEAAVQADVAHEPATEPEVQRVNPFAALRQQLKLKH
ncbi:DUF177 domain-containing protein [Sinimarinibacterium sp. NLF-5-8]|uniref:YceD family protein n=1 Tax=Sinimarinibacterium sp. NLF-5-8 TaxID=2698684 RepID=UPI00137BC918|nr:YceD family protein [Sinimarinibacterium sp. NLF-5-8]QHS08957.1 hypothetical protein GT972_01570 [Sinimarinibacterium sp. NLF-5-8]